MVAHCTVVPQGGTLAFHHNVTRDEIRGARGSRPDDDNGSGRSIVRVRQLKVLQPELRRVVTLVDKVGKVTGVPPVLRGDLVIKVALHTFLPDPPESGFVNVICDGHVAMAKARAAGSVGLCNGPDAIHISVADFGRGRAVGATIAVVLVMNGLDGHAEQEG
jgi:hypothetical protein